MCDFFYMAGIRMGLFSGKYETDCCIAKVSVYCIVIRKKSKVCCMFLFGFYTKCVSINSIYKVYSFTNVLNLIQCKAVQQLYNRYHRYSKKSEVCVERNSDVIITSEFNHTVMSTLISHQSLQMFGLECSNYSSLTSNWVRTVCFIRVKSSEHCVPHSMRYM